MDKIQELHYDAIQNYSGNMQLDVDHAAITEDLMGRFLEWTEKEGFKKTIGDAYIKIGYTHRYYMSELINMFKETL